MTTPSDATSVERTEAGIDAALRELAATTFAEAPSPPPFAVVRLFAERRREEAHQRRALRGLALASALPLVAVGIAALVAPLPASDARGFAALVAAFGAAALAASAGALRRWIAAGRG